ncbi:HMG-Y-related protein B-like [Juglans microcarpa x Juglans regia]|uniref:HMG-Y-related protein B-like n=1 Tax=Juglans microcarpa x Juglans regia TaxID=2249226 RepID=UPI001B7F0EF9|nr:HMG-Y-related protein B-like [Juglans microcarpa x Juglans regia]
MATEEIHNPPLAQPPTPAASLPQYPEMIMAAIEALNDKNGSDKSAISSYIESTYTDLPEAHSTLLSHHLDQLKQSGKLVLVQNNYMKPDPNAPPRRGRGRPPKPKATVPSGTVVGVGPPRPRGRPPKPRDPFAPPPPPKAKNASSGSGRPRGRPPKKAKTASAPAPASAAGGAPRGRGRPPKVKPAVAPVGC